MLRRRPTPVISRRRAPLFGLILGLGAAALVVPLVPSSEAVHLGDRAPRTLEAAHDAPSESEPLTDAVRAEAARKVEDVYFPPDPAVRDGQVQKLDALLTAVDGIRARSSSVQQRLSELASVPGAAGFSASTQLALISLDDRAYTQLETDVRKALVEVLNRPVQPNTASQ